MATIGKSQQVYSNGTKSNWTVASDLDTSTGKITTTLISGNGSIVFDGTPETVAKNIANIPVFSKEPDFFNGLIAAVNSQAAGLKSTQDQLNPPPATEPVPPAATVENNPNDLNATSASDDKSYDKVEAARLNNAKSNSDNNTTNSNTETSSLTQSFAGQTQSGKANSDSTSSSNAPENNPTDKPGRRPYNPLSTFSSYNYQITLYMVSPDAYNLFVRSGRTNLLAYASTDPNSPTKGAGGVFIVAQSGGQGTTIPRPPGIELDYYIDNVKIKSSINGKSSTTSSVASEISFNIYEPYGFSLPTKLKLAASALNQKSNLPNVKDIQNPSRNLYILGIRFLGYDEKGEIVKQQNPQEGSYETYYEILIREFKFKLDGKVTVYDITAVPTPTQVGFGAKRGRVSTGAMVTGKTVEDVLIGPDGLLTKLNQQQEQLAKESGNTKIGIPNRYNVEFVGPNADRIKNANLITDIDKKNKQIWPMSAAATKAQVTDYLSVVAKPNDTKRSLTFAKDISVQQAVSSIITTSDYLTNTLKLGFKGDIDTMIGKDNEKESKDKKEVQWYNLSCSVECLGWDNIVGDFAYEITYWIMVYDTPNIVSSYTAKTPKYYGAYKKYDYWFTGKNSEILRYEQKIDNSYFYPVLVPTGTATSQSSGADIPIAPLTQSNLDRTGGLNLSREAQNNYLTNLYDPGSFTNVKIEIMGDPDFLLNDNPVTRTAQYKQFYGSDGYKINPNTGQVFIEVRFNEGIDYDQQSGVMSLNQNILFYQNPKSVPEGLKGVSFMVVTLESIFSGGKFTQVLDCNINIFPNPTTPTQEGNANTRGLEVRAEDGSLSSLKRNPETGELYTPVDSPRVTGFVPETPVPSYNDTSKLVNNDNNQVSLGYTTGATQQTSPTGGGSGVTEKVAGGATTQIDPTTNNPNSPTVNKNVANDDAVPVLGTSPANAKKTLESSSDGREPTQQSSRTYVEEPL